MPFASHASHRATARTIYERVTGTGPDSLIDSREETGRLGH